ncbi:MAG: hypothetical protein MH825_12465 [Cyanobacteria bacterium]|nr:hypothetical protein [Cyanobacteriota bacterium]
MIRSLQHIISESSLAFHLLINSERFPEISYHSLDIDISSEVKIYLEELALDSDQEFGSLDWVTAISEVQWEREENLDLTSQLYYPPIFVKNSLWPLEDLFAKINKLRGQILVEIISQSVSNNSDRPWNRALVQAIKHLQELDPDERTLHYDKALTLYQKLLKDQPAKLYRLSVRAFSEYPADALNLLTTWTDIVLGGDQHPAIKLYEPHNPRFAEHLHTFAERKPAPLQPWPKYKHTIGQLTFDKVIPPPKKGFLDRYGDGSLSSPQPKLSSPFKQKILDSQSSTSASLTDSTIKQEFGASLVRQPSMALAQTDTSSGSLLSTLHSGNLPPAAVVADLQPLSSHFSITIAERFVAPCIEIVNHYRNLRQTEMNKPFAQTYTLESLIQSHGNLISSDEYIVGTDSIGQPILSDFRVSAHRFVAGEVGAGKTNFLKVLLYQLLWHDPNRPIWLADFKKGVDFQVVSKIFPNVQLITDYAAFDQLLKDFWSRVEDRVADKQQDIQDELERLLSLTPEKRQRYKEEQDQKRDEASWGRNILIIDEMAQLIHLYDDKDRDQKEIANSIQASLDRIVRLGRASKANVIFCTQSKEERIIDNNLLNNVGDRLIFRVSADTVSMRFLGSDKASKLSPRHKGRGIYLGPDYAGDAEDLKEVATPRFPDDDLVTELNFWEQLKNKSLSP